MAEFIYNEKEDYYHYDIFAPYVDALQSWFTQKKNITRLKSEGYTAKDIQDAIELYEELCFETCEEYFSNRKDLFNSEENRQEFKEHIEILQENVLNSNFYELPDKFKMEETEAEHQCKRADEAFKDNKKLQKLLADANYSFFSGRTMATAKDLLDFDKLGEFYTEGMPHLTASNTAIGYSVKEYILEKAKEGETEFTITDMGSGSGATLAAIMLGLSDADKIIGKREDKIKININSIEGCYEFYRLLEDEMMPAIEKMGKSLNNFEFKIDLKYGDIRSEIKNIKTSGTQEINNINPSGTQIYTANYMFHRLTDETKEEVCNIIGEKTKDQDAAFFLADIYRNSSKMPNRGYFNFAFNGPLNPGNDPELMKELMSNNGFTQVFIDENIPLFKNTEKSEIRLIKEACMKAKKLKQGFIITGYKTGDKSKDDEE